ncbi:DNA-binding response regulator, NarL/FixJ family, contains REC and HTH domains [Sinosporangium album]|uniref:DNA-binding response regulator, NarL/FixJ family, contains REC and HTH domains n=1 Tax=Sinosporangium album TaxID=504805 RepID=A0A1G7SCI3_9ACTN|nr:response regulator [Sinosporangium album]SDG20703.1 DNA-binding response regulator, NarL/FixJ family, contains REC and HTH domains [Sinosporangium album]
MNGRIAIVDDHPLARDWLMRELTRAGHTIAAVVANVERLDPGQEVDLVICDHSLPNGRSGTAAVEYLIRREYRVLSASGVAKTEAVLDAVGAGACGFINKNQEVEDYARAVAAVLADGCYLSPLLAGFLLADAGRRPLDADEIGRPERLLLRTIADGKTSEEAVAALGLTRDAYLDRLRLIFTAACRRRRKYRLSPRELQIVRLIARDDLSARRIGEVLHISTDTVSDHMESIKRKYVALHPDCDLRPRAIVLKWARELDMSD